MFQLHNFSLRIILTKNTMFALSNKVKFRINSSEIILSILVSAFTFVY